MKPTINQGAFHTKTKVINIFLVCIYCASTIVYPIMMNYVKTLFSTAEGALLAITD